MENKIGLRSSLAVLLIIASIGSYVFLNAVSAQHETLENTAIENIISEEEESSKDEILLPDVEIIKKVLEKTRHVISAS